VKPPEAAAPAARDPIDAVRALIYFLAILLVGLGVVVYLLVQRRDAVRASTSRGDGFAKDLNTTYGQVEGLLKSYSESGAGEARERTTEWLTKRHEVAGIDQKQVRIDPWKNRRKVEGGEKPFEENYLRVRVTGVPREKAMQFVWNVERQSTMMRSLSLKLERTTGKDIAPEADVWNVDILFGYRVSGRKEGS